jgi:hypothetical protein
MGARLPHHSFHQEIATRKCSVHQISSGGWCSRSPRYHRIDRNLRNSSTRSPVGESGITGRGAQRNHWGYHGSTTSETSSLGGGCKHLQNLDNCGASIEKNKLSWHLSQCPLKFLTMTWLDSLTQLQETLLTTYFSPVAESLLWTLSKTGKYV